MTLKENEVPVKKIPVHLAFSTSHQMYSWTRLRHGSPLLILTWQTITLDVPPKKALQNLQVANVVEMLGMVEEMRKKSPMLNLRRTI